MKVLPSAPISRTDVTRVTNGKTSIRIAEIEPPSTPLTRGSSESVLRTVRGNREGRPTELLGGMGPVAKRGFHNGDGVGESGSRRRVKQEAGWAELTDWRGEFVACDVPSGANVSFRTTTGDAEWSLPLKLGARLNVIEIAADTSGTRNRF